MKNVQYFLALSSFMWLCSPVKNTNIVDNGEQLRSDKISSNSLSENHSKGEVSIVNRMLPASDGRDISAETNTDELMKMRMWASLDNKNIGDRLDRLTNVAGKEMHQLRETIGEKIDQLTTDVGAGKKEMKLMTETTGEKMTEVSRVIGKQIDQCAKIVDKGLAEKENQLKQKKKLEDDKNELLQEMKELGDNKNELLQKIKKLENKENHPHEIIQPKYKRGSGFTGCVIVAGFVATALLLYYCFHSGEAT